MAELIEQYKATGPGDGKELEPSYNVAPTNKVYAVLERSRPDDAGAVREVRAVRWGLVPAWWKPGIDPKTGKAKTMPTLHNARADRVATAPSWRGPFAKRRAVIPAAGYYEWLPTEDADGKPVKQPYYIRPADGMLSFAGLYELWPDPAKDENDPDRWLWSAAIITPASQVAWWVARAAITAGRSRAPPNAAAESFHSTVEFELLREAHFATRAEARHAVVAFLEEYNHHRRHSTHHVLPRPGPCGRAGLCRRCGGLRCRGWPATAA
jgi:putative SOS response-associated peptidase YedK